MCLLLADIYVSLFPVLCVFDFPFAFCSLSTLCDVVGEEFVLFSIVVLRQGAESYRNLLREKRFVVRPFKYDPAEDKAERERKLQLAVKKKNLCVRCFFFFFACFVFWSFFIQACAEARPL